MNAPLHAQWLLRPAEPAQQDQQELALATDGVLRLVWQHRFGSMLIEVEGERVFVNRQPVEPFAPSSPRQDGDASSTRQVSS